MSEDERQAVRRAALRTELEYRRWCGMIQRCENPRHVSYCRYGAKGVMVSPEWRSNYVAFLRDVGRAPSREHTLDRIDNARGYEPGNVRWATQQQQQRNKSSNSLLMFRGEMVPQVVVVEASGLPQGTVAKRAKLGWTGDEIVDRPVDLGRGNGKKTHCSAGHLYDAANTHIAKCGKRVCRACARDLMRMKRARGAAR